MNNLTLRKVLSLAVCVILLLSLFTACGKKDSTETTGATEETVDPSANGILMLNANAAVNIVYNGGGEVMEIEGLDINGKDIAEACSDQVGNSCGEAVSALIAKSTEFGYLTADKYVVLKQTKGSKSPSENFLEEMKVDAQSAAGTQVPVITVTMDDLAADGYIGLVKAKEIVLAFMGVDSCDLFDGTDTPVDGYYGFSVGLGDMEPEDVIMDADTGAVSAGSLNISYDDMEQEYDPSQDHIGATEGTEPVESTAPTEEATAPAEEN